jgi:hypothetical protein
MMDIGSMALTSKHWVVIAVLALGAVAIIQRLDAAAQ